MESNNFFDNLGVKSVDFLSLWDPLIVNLTFKLVSLCLNRFSEVSDIVFNILSKILVSLGGMSPVVRNLLWVLEFNGTWSFSGCWGNFALSNLVLPGSSVLVLNVITSDFPFFSFFFECLSLSTGVLDVSFKVFFDVPI
jgi:hypothetical protein